MASSPLIARPKIVIDSNIPFVKGMLEPLCDVVYLSSIDICNQNIKDANALVVRTRTKCDKKLLSNTSIKFVASATSGSDHINFDYCRQNGIEVFVAKGCNATSVAQYVASAMAIFAKEKSIELHNKTVGIVGYGFVGKEVEKISKILKMNVLKNDPLLEKNGDEKGLVSLLTIAENADIITFHTNLTTDGLFPSYHLANKTFFEELRKKPLLINAARGGVVDEKMMINAKKQGKISDFVVDCWENEPNISQQVLEMALIATPHIAGYSANSKAKATQMCINALCSFFELNQNKLTNTPTPLPKTYFDKDNNNAPEQFLGNYNIEIDCNRLKKSPEQFEHQRNNYPERREIECEFAFA